MVEIGLKMLDLKTVTVSVVKGEKSENRYHD